MCEYCGCQQIAVLGELTREHDAAVGVLSTIRGLLADGDLAGAAASCRALRAILGPHTEVEEQGLFPELTAEYPDHVDVLRREHQRIDAVLGEADAGTPTDPAWARRLLDVSFLLREHILKEQDGVFPAALGILDGDQWERVEHVRARVGTALGDPPPAPRPATTRTPT